MKLYVSCSRTGIPVMASFFEKYREIIAVPITRASKPCRFAGFSKLFLLVGMLFVFSAGAIAQVAGDYRTRASGNWNVSGTWQKWNGSSWVNCTGSDYPGSAVGAGDVNVKNNVTLNVSPNWPIKSLEVNANLTPTNDDYTLKISEDFIVKSGTVTLATKTGFVFPKKRSVTINIGGDFVLSKNGIVTAISDQAGQINFVGNATHIYTNTDVPRSQIQQLVDFTVESGSTLDVGTSIIDGGGSFNLKSGATLITAHGEGVSSGNFGSIRTSYALNLNQNANYVFNGTSAQSIGNAITSANKLTINNAAGVTLSRSVRVGNELILEAGSLSLGSSSYDLTLVGGASISSPTGFDASCMIVCDGSGFLVKESSQVTDFNMTFPIGTAGHYSPVLFSSFVATLSGSSAIKARVVAGAAPTINTTDLQKYWDMKTSGIANITTDISFLYSNSDIGAGGDQSSYVPYVYNGSVWTAPSSGGPGENPMKAISSTYIDGVWTGREGPTTYYSYQSGNWNSAVTWTKDPSGTLSIGPKVPGSLDRAVILNGRTIFMTNAQSVLSTNINEGGVLDLRNVTGHNLGDVRGKGTMKLSTGVFPGGVFDEFVSTAGGTVEYNLNTAFNFNQYLYNNLIVNLSATGNNAIVLSDLVVNSNLTINRGRFYINDMLKIPITITIFGDLFIESKGEIRVGYGKVGQPHNLILHGDFTNNGKAYFTQQTSANYTAYPDQRVDVIFKNPSKNQNVQINGPTLFYRIEVDKGTDKTYILNIDASEPNLFQLFGRNNISQAETLNSPNLNALGLQIGTLRLGRNISIESLFEDYYGVYAINDDACLWLDGASVTHTKDWDASALVVYGKLKLTNHETIFNCNVSQGIVMRANAEIEIEDGLLETSCIRTSSIAGVHRGSYTQRGGVVNLKGNFSNADNHPTFSMTHPNMSFNMSGGQLNVKEATNSGVGRDASFGLGAYSENVSMTGGIIRMYIKNRNACFASSSPFWNLEIIDESSGSNSSVNKALSVSGSGSVNIPAFPLIVLNDLTIKGTSKFDANSLDVFVGRNFTIESAARYIPGSNTTGFNGRGAQSFTNIGTVASGLFNLSFENRTNTIISRDILVRKDLSIASSCIVQDAGNTIDVRGNVVNSGLHISQASGAILFSGGATQSIGGDGEGVFGSITINKTSGLASFSANQSMKGNLRLIRGLLDINTYKLSLGTLTNIYDVAVGTTAVFNASKMIRCSGSMSDGGLSKAFSSTNVFVFPFGSGTTYTPATIRFSTAPATWGTITIKPVAEFSRFATSAKCLNYYWKVSESGFSGIAPNSVHHTYMYDNSALTGRGSEALYIPAFYNPFAWEFVNDVSLVVDATNEIRFNSLSSLTGDYTAGEINAFNAVKVFYSRQNGNWNNINTWSSVEVGGPVDGSLPGANSPVVIGDGLGQNHTVTIPVGQNARVIGGLVINTESTLDITTTTGHNFGSVPESKVGGAGLLRISSATATAAFPAGDFGNFLSPNGGTVEYYTTGTQNFIMPVNVGTYNNLQASPATGSLITFPNTDLIVFGDLTVSGLGTGAAPLNAVSSKTLTVNGDINIISGILRYSNVNAQTVVAKKNINISSAASFIVNDAGAARSNALDVYGNLVNDGVFKMLASSNRICNVTFAGSTNNYIAGTGSNVFNTLTVDKGISRATVLDVTANNLTLSNTAGAALILNNGNFRVSNSSLNITLSTTTSFTIPSTAALSVFEGKVNIGTTNNNGDLLLSGRLEISNNGTVNVGNGGNFNNDIEYAAGGTPEIIVSGNGTLNVNGQIRRPTGITTGSLRYTQRDNSSVNIGGNAANSARSMIEVLNLGSEFNMSGGILTIARNFNNSDINELHLVPSSSVVTGGEIRVGSSFVNVNSQFNIVSSVPLWDLTVEATTKSNIANVRVYPLNIKRDLTIEGNSELRANGLDVSIGRNLTNNNNGANAGVTTGGFQPGSSTQTTTFNGSSSRTISGSGSNLTNFANLILSTPSQITLSSNSYLYVNGNLTIASGTLMDGGNEITVIGNLDNKAMHKSPSSTGGIIMFGSQRQTVSGNGTSSFGNFRLDNYLGVELADNTIINGVLTFVNGPFYINDYLLTLGVNASIAGSPSVQSMIVLNGVVSDQGVQKLYSASPADFSFPVGVAGKYTPVRYNITSNTAVGTITVKPVNSRHPFTKETPSAVNELQYYWNTIATGFAGLSVSHQYHYDNNDALPDETDYKVGRFVTQSGMWSAPLEGIMNVSSDYFSINNVNYISGEYTCGVNSGATANFIDIPTYYSRNIALGGDWTDKNSWTLSPDGSGPAVALYPQGNPVVILLGHTITVNANAQSAYSVEVNGVLNVKETIYHSFGHISGAGTMDVTSTSTGNFVIPGGDYVAFMANPASTIIFRNNRTGVSNVATLPTSIGSAYKPFQNVVFAGAGVKEATASNMKVLRNLTINQGLFDNSVNNKNISILGDWIDNSNAPTGGFIAGRGIVEFLGSSQQSLIVIKNIKEQFYNLKINNTAGLVLSGAGEVEVNQSLYLTKGMISTNQTNMLSLTSTAMSAAVGASSLSFVNGPLRKSINSGSSFNFPVGDATRYGNVSLSNVTSAGTYIAQYYNQSTAAAGYSPLSRNAPIDIVSDNEYWRINGPSASADVTIRWDATSGIIPIAAQSRAKLRIVEWNGSAWDNKGNVIKDGGVASGTIKTSPTVFVGGDNIFTIGVESLPTIKINSLESSFCSDGIDKTSVDVSLTGTAPWKIKYTVNGGSETTIDNIATSSFSIIVNSSSPGITLPGAYIYRMTYVMDATGSTGVADFAKVVTVTMKKAPTPLIAGLTTLPLNATTEYSVAHTAGNVYIWSISSNGSIVSGGNTSAAKVKFTSGTSGWVSVSEASPNGCSAVTEQYSIVISDIPVPLVSGEEFACNSETVTYSTPNVPGHTYSWTLSGGGAIIGVSNTASVNITWATNGSHTVTVKEKGSVFVSNTLDVSVNTLPLNNQLLTVPATACINSNTEIVIKNAEAGCDYTIRHDSDNTELGSVHASFTGDLVLSFVPQVSGAVVYNILAENEYQCSQVLTKKASIAVSPENTIVLFSAVGTDSLSVVYGQPITEVVFNTSGATGATVSPLPAGVSSVWNANKLKISGTPTVSGVFNYEVVLVGGCPIPKTTGSITIYSTFYSNGGDMAALANWGIETDGSGMHPVSPFTPGLKFVLPEDKTAILSGSWNLGAGSTLEIDGELTPVPNAVISGSDATLGGKGLLRVTRTGSEQYSVATKNLTEATMEYTSLSGGQVVSGDFESKYIRFLNTSGINTANGNVASGNIENISGGTLDMCTYELLGPVDNTGSTIRFGGATNGRAISIGSINYSGDNQQVHAGLYDGLIISGGGNKTLSGDITVQGKLSLVDGILATGTSKMLYMNADASIALPLSPTSYVEGPMVHSVSGTSTSTRVFPVGGAGSLHRMDISVVHTDAVPTDYLCEYRASDANLIGYDLPASENITKVSHVGYWHVSKSNEIISSDGKIDSHLASAKVMMYYSAVNDRVTMPSKLNVAKSNGVTGAWENVGGLASDFVTDGILESSIFRTFCDLSLANGVGGYNPLPVNLTAFTASIANQKVLLRWTVATELNNDYFSIEKSSNGIDFVEFATVKGAGTSSLANNYMYLDNLVGSGVIYYRLKQIDYDGTETILGTKSIRLRDRLNSESVDLYIGQDENFSDKIHLELLSVQDVKVSIYTAAGATVTVKRALLDEGVTDLFIHDIAQLIAGSYIVTVETAIKTYSFYYSIQ